MARCPNMLVFQCSWLSGIMGCLPFTFFHTFNFDTKCLIPCLFCWILYSCWLAFLLDHRAMMVKNMVATILQFMKFAIAKKIRRITFCIDLYKDSISLYKQVAACQKNSVWVYYVYVYLWHCTLYRHYKYVCMPVCI